MSPMSYAYGKWLEALAVPRLEPCTAAGADEARRLNHKCAGERIESGVSRLRRRCVPGTHMRNNADIRRVEAPLGQLERSLIEEFVRARGHEPNTLADLPEHERERLLADASIYASGKLTEVEARSHFVDEIHDGTADT